MTDAKPRTSVVIPAYRAWATLEPVLDALEPQVAGRRREVVLVDSSADGRAAELERRRPWMRVIALADRTLPGTARNLGVERARGDLIAFLDADTVPYPAWLDRLEAALTDDVEAVAGAVLNGTPRSLVGTAGFLLEFMEFVPPRSRPLLYAPGGNLLLRRSTFLELGGFRDDVWPGEDTIFTFDLCARGAVAFVADAAVLHLNRSELAAFLRHQRRLGLTFARVCEHVDFPRRTLGRPWAAPLAVPARWLAVARFARAHPRYLPSIVVLSPLLAVGIVLYAVGQASARR